MTKRFEYKPKPLDTSSIELPEDLEKLTEFLALNVHELWSQEKLSEGWEFGEKHDDNSKKTPNLVPYDMLPDHMKEYDRKTAIGTIKIIISLGYHITKNS
ncbi:MAG: RyR domain-containing protein [Candidatus Hodarchaeales archaeon]|jgi:hypothetical protein